MSNDIYKKYNIDISKLKRDYLKYPLKQFLNKFGHPFEEPYKEDLEYLYIELNIPRNILCEYFNFSSFVWKKLIKKFNIKKTNEQIHKNSILSYNYNKVLNKEHKNNIIQKRKKTKLERYGDENYNNMEKYYKTNIEKYGIYSYTKTNDYIIKSKNTNMKRYGTPWANQNDNIKAKMKKTKLERYGDENYNNYKKGFKTKIKNNSFNKSNDEEIIFSILKKDYPNTMRQYKSELYPFFCDFYVPELDLYIEYQGFKSHGCEPFIGTPEQIKKVNLWKEKSKEINFRNEHKKLYEGFINTWTKRDPMKRKIAKENKLNWKEFFTVEDFISFWKNNT